jgi:hypothetical protein
VCVALQHSSRRRRACQTCQRGFWGVPVVPGLVLMPDGGSAPQAVGTYVERCDGIGHSMYHCMDNCTDKRRELRLQGLTAGQVAPASVRPPSSPFFAGCAPGEWLLPPCATGCAEAGGGQLLLRRAAGWRSRPLLRVAAATRIEALLPPLAAALLPQVVVPAAPRSSSTQQHLVAWEGAVSAHRVHDAAPGSQMPLRGHLHCPAGPF